MTPFVWRCVLSAILFATASFVHIEILEHGWALLLSNYPGVEYSYTDSEHLYANIFRWTEHRDNYRNYRFGVIFSTRCTYFHVWAMCIPFFVTGPSLWSCAKAIILAGLLVSFANVVRLIVAYSAVNRDIPWWVAHDIPNFALGLVLLGLSVAYYRRHTAAREVHRDGTSH